MFQHRRLRITRSFCAGWAALISFLLFGCAPKQAGLPDGGKIPALLNPPFVRASEVDFLNDQDLVLGVVLDGQPRAYPIRILDQFEVLNDTVGDIPILATF